MKIWTVPLNNDMILKMGAGREVTNTSRLMNTNNLYDRDKEFAEDVKRNGNNIFSQKLFGTIIGGFDSRSTDTTSKFGYITMTVPYISPLSYAGKSAPLSKILDIENIEVDKLVRGKSLLIIPTDYKTVIATLGNKAKPVQLNFTEYKKLTCFLIPIEIFNEYKIILSNQIILSGAFAFSFLLSSLNLDIIENELNNTFANYSASDKTKSIATRYKYVKSALINGSITDCILWYYPVIPVEYRSYQTGGETHVPLDVINVLYNSLLILNNTVKESILYKIQHPEPNFCNTISNIVNKYKCVDDYSQNNFINDLFTMCKKYFDYFTSEVFLNTINELQTNILDEYLFNKRTKTKAFTEVPYEHPNEQSIAQRMGGKEGFVRDSVTDRRIDFSGRSVITVNPDLELDEISIPYDILKKWFLKGIKSKIKNRLKNSNFPPTTYTDSIINTAILDYRHHHAVLYKSDNDDLTENLDKIFREEIYNYTEEVCKHCRVVDIRYPSLHRWNVMGAKIVPDYINKSIGIHPLIVSAYNADFDGDQKSLFNISTPKAIEEVDNVMLFSKNAYDAHGNPRHMPTQECITGLYVATKMEEGSEPTRTFTSVNHLKNEYKLGRVDIDAVVKISTTEEISTVGRFILNSDLPIPIEPIIKETKAKGLTKKGVSKLLGQLIELSSDDNDKLRYYHDYIKDFGFKVITKYGLSLGLSDLIEPKNKEELIKTYEEDYLKISNQDLNIKEKYDVQIERGMKFSYDMLDAVKKTLQPDNPVRLLVDSGSRGSWTGIVQLIGARGIMEDPYGNYLPKAVTTNFCSGISIADGVIGSYGGANGSVSKSRLTADTGALARNLAYALHTLNITQGDCGDTEGYLIQPCLHHKVIRDELGNLYILNGYTKELIFTFGITTLKDTNIKVTYDGDVLYDKIAVYNFYHKRILDKYLWNTIPAISEFVNNNINKLDIPYILNTDFNIEYMDINHFKIYDRNQNLIINYQRDYKINDFIGRVLIDGTYITSNNIDVLKEKLTDSPHGIFIRSPLSCKSPNGICSKCFGLSYTDYPKTLVPVGSAVGMLVAHIIGELLTQASMRVFHTGGTALGGSTKTLFSEAKKIIQNKIVLNKDMSEKVKKVSDAFKYNLDSDFIPSVINGVQELYKEHKAIPSGLPKHLTYEDLGMIYYGAYLDITKAVLNTFKELFIQEGSDMESIYAEVVIKQMMSVVNIVNSGDTKLYKGSDVTWFEFCTQNRDIVRLGLKPAVCIPVKYSLNKMSSSVGTDNAYLKASFDNFKRSLITSTYNYGVTYNDSDNDNIAPILFGQKYNVGKELTKKLLQVYTEINNNLPKYTKINLENTYIEADTDNSTPEIIETDIYDDIFNFDNPPETVKEDTIEDTTVVLDENPVLETSFGGRKEE